MGWEKGALSTLAIAAALAEKLVLVSDRIATSAPHPERLLRTKDVEIQNKYGVTYHRYWFNEETGDVFCLAEATNKEAAEAVHREAHRLMADEITEVEEGQP